MSVLQEELPKSRTRRRQSRILIACRLLLAILSISASPALASDKWVFFAPGSVASEPLWAFTFFQGASAGKDSILVDLLRNPWSGDYGHGWFTGAAASRKIARFYQHFTLEGEVGLGARYGHDNHGGDGWAAAYVRFDGFPWRNVLRTSVGFSTGLSYLTDPEFDVHVLHYFGPELAVALPSHPNTELVLRFHHRSSVFGLMASQREGSNVISLGIRIRH